MHLFSNRNSLSGCASGFGYQTAIELNKLGFKVLATCRDPHSGGAKRLIEEATNPSKMIVLGMDVTNDNNIECAYETITNAMTSSESLFALVNNAGVATLSELEIGTDLNELMKPLDVNLIGMIKVTRKFLPLIRQSKGRIVNIGSMGGLIPAPHSFFYSISKSAARGFSDNLRLSMYKFGVTVVSIMPWIYKTQMTDPKLLVERFEYNYKNSSEEVRKAYGKTYADKVNKYVTTMLNYGSTSLDVSNTIVDALTAHEPYPQYIVASTKTKTWLTFLALWTSKEMLDVVFQILAWFYGVGEVHPETETKCGKSN